MTIANAIEIRQVTKTYGSGEAVVTAVSDASLAIRQNEFFTLLGPSGCGKTTLLRLIAGFEFPSSGELMLDGQQIGDVPPFRRPINTVFQSYALFPHMTVSENIGFGLKMLGKPQAEIAARVAAMLELVRMEAFGTRKVSQLSGGQQQRVALARALAPQPKVLLLDEPLSALDYKLRKDMQIELKRLQSETGITFVFVTHDQEEALTMSDRIAVMSAGKILQVGSPREIYDAPQVRFVADFIGETNFLDGRITGHSGAVAHITLSNGQSIDADMPEGFAPTSTVTVMVRPEHASLVEAEDPLASLIGNLTDIVYFGTDTYFHIETDAGSDFTVRAQNRPSQRQTLKSGDRVGVVFEAGSARVLRN